MKPGGVGVAGLTDPVSPNLGSPQFFGDMMLLPKEEEEYREWFHGAAFDDVRLQRIGLPKRFSN